SPTHYFRGLSPSGELVVSYRPTERPDWLRKWWPLKEDDATFVITDWRTGVERAHFRDMVHLEFSPDNEHLAITRPGNIVEGYAWPLRPPWGLLIAATLGAAFGMWCIGWLWARWRARRSSTQMERGKDKDEVQHALAPLSDSITRVS
ncbi:MAG TPA: hypothetical protein VFE62_12080, partial [Gemmataceae bacterium]|nr:hypothetical protein [Gemmataceae bacterium]